MPNEFCPIGSVSDNAGGQIDAKVGKGKKQTLRYTYTQKLGSGGDTDARCAFVELNQRTVDNPIMDVTQACRRCTRAVRLQSSIRR